MNFIKIFIFAYPEEWKKISKYLLSKNYKDFDIFVKTKLEGIMLKNIIPYKSFEYNKASLYGSLLESFIIYSAPDEEYSKIEDTQLLEILSREQSNNISKSTTYRRLKKYEKIALEDKNLAKSIIQHIKNNNE